jgi:hypothetical protein
MLQPHYETVFEIGLKSFPWGALLHPIPFIALGVVLFLLAKKKAAYRAAYRIVGAFVMALATLFFIIGTVSYVSEFVERRRAYKTGHSLVVEGTIENFSPPPAFGGQKESFSVQGIVLSYYVGDWTPCFHDDLRHNGPIRPGLEVRIYYDDGCIQRIDVGKEVPK